MSLISHNAGPKIPKKKREDGEEAVHELMRENGGFDPDLVQVLGTKKRKKGKEKKLEIEQEREMKKLENVLFGSIYSSSVGHVEEDMKQLDDVDDSSALFFMDRSADDSLLGYQEGPVVSEDMDNYQLETQEKKAVWVDEEEEETKINVANVNRLRKLRKEEDESVISGSEYVSRLRAQHAKLNPGTQWAQRSGKGGSSYDDSSDDEYGVVIAPDRRDAEAVDDILQTNEELAVRSSSTKLMPGILEYSKLVDANAEDPSSGPINSVQFHRNAQLLLTAGLDRRLRFFQIDGKRNTKIQSIFFDDCPIRKASFLPDGSQVIISGRRKFFYSFDLVKAQADRIGPLVGREEKSLEDFEVSQDSKTIAFVGNEGYILLVSTKTKELIGTLKMNGTVRSLAFADDGRQLLSSGGDGHVYHWDLRTRTCFHKGVDEGCLNGTALCTSPTGTLFAAGSDSGIVTVYDRDEFLGGKRKPLKTIKNLTTKVDFLKFNNDAQILAICSGMKKNSLKLIHVPSYNVFSNWPPMNRTLHHPRCLDFSPGGGFMAVGSAAGKVLLYKLHHYQHA